MCLRLVLARFIICTISGTLGSICLVSPPRGLFTRSSQAGLTTGMVYYHALSMAAPFLWNSLPLPIRQETSIDSFKRSVKTYLFKKAFN
ncbi:unnamed protein product [Porites lobata]|uniref:Secreted protein n=1 Tax=Porites lobata TaxID=104759 RepID=A0ABN8PHP9_9CNID|nr:unnamed protein product [Porites lobata]